MGDFEHEETELDWINLFHSSIIGYPTFKKNKSCFREFGYRASIFPKFKILSIENQDNPKGIEITPDFLLWNQNKEIAIIIEIKGGNSIEKKDITQINNYKQLSNEQIETYIKNATEQKDIKIRFTITCIVYKNNTINRCLNSSSCNKRLETLSKNNLVMMQNHNESLKLLNPNGLNFDKKLIDALMVGIELPLNPKTEFYMTDNPCKKGIIWGIGNYIFDNFFEGEQIEEVSISPGKLKNEIFKYSMAKLSDFRIALEFLLKYNFCKRGSRYQFIFDETFLRKYNQLRKILINYNCNSKIKLQEELDKFI